MCFFLVLVLPSIIISFVIVFVLWLKTSCETSSNYCYNYFGRHQRMPWTINSGMPSSFMAWDRYEALSRYNPHLYLLHPKWHHTETSTESRWWEKRGLPSATSGDARSRLQSWWPGPRRYHTSGGRTPKHWASRTATWTARPRKNQKPGSRSMGTPTKSNTRSQRAPSRGGRATGRTTMTATTTAAQEAKDATRPSTPPTPAGIFFVSIWN